MRYIFATFLLFTVGTVPTFSQGPLQPQTWVSGPGNSICPPSQQTVCLDTLGLAAPAALGQPWVAFRTVDEIDDYFRQWLQIEATAYNYHDLQRDAYHVALRTGHDPEGHDGNITNYQHSVYRRAWWSNAIPTYTYSSTLLAQNPVTLQNLVRGSTHKLELPVGSLIFSQKAEELANSQAKSRYDFMEKVYQPLRDSRANRASLIVQLHDALVDARRALDVQLQLRATVVTPGSPEPRTLAAIAARLHKDYGLKTDEIEKVLSAPQNSEWGKIRNGLELDLKMAESQKELVARVKAYQDAMAQVTATRAKLAAANAKLDDITEGDVGRIVP